MSILCDGDDTTHSKICYSWVLEISVHQGGDLVLFLAEPELYFDHTRSYQLPLHKIEEMVEGFRGERVEQDNKLKAQEQLIEKLQRTVKMLEKKERAQEKKLKGYRYRVGK